MIENKYHVNFKTFFLRELKTLEEFIQDGIVEINDVRLELTQVGRHLAPVVASVFDAFVDTPRYSKDIYVPRISD